MMKKNLFLMWLMLLAILFSVNMEAQMTIGGKKEPEPFSVLELLNKGGLRLPQMTTAERNAFAVKNNVKGEGLTIYNIDTKCVEYWNKVRWVSLCEGDSQATISPQPCIGVPADGTGCDSTFVITDPDCPNGPFNIAIVAGADYASLNDVDNGNGTFKIAFKTNETVNTHTVLVRVTSTCTSLYKEFLFSQNGVDCSTMPYTVPSVSPATPSLTLCAGGAVYLSVPANTANLDKLIWTRNGIEIARGVNNIMVTQKGKYNISMGAVGCNTNAANERTVTESGTVAPIAITALASNNGVICGTNSVILSATGTTGTVAWFHNGVEEKTGATVSISGDSSVGDWFAAVKDGSCYSKPSNTLNITKSDASGGQVTVSNADVLVNGLPLNTFTAFCAGGTLDLTVNNKQNGITYTWFNGNDIISTNPFIVPSGQPTISLRMVATDNSGAKCPAEANVIEKNVITGSTPAQPNITGNGTLCDGTTDLTLVPAVAGTYTYTWYKDGVKMPDNTATITVTTPGVTYSGSVTNTTGCSSTLAKKAISPDLSSLPVLSWVGIPVTTGTFGAKVTLQVSVKFGADSYAWAADNGATVTGSGSTVTVQMPASGTDGTVVKVTVTAQNSCGKSNTLEAPITLNNACPTPSLTAQSDAVQTVTAGSSVTEKVSVTDGVKPTYQWYKNTIASTTGGTAISGATAASYIYTPATPGNSYLYCIVTNGCNGSPTSVSSVFTITATIDPGTLPAGSGTLTGKTCFDIAESNDNNTCGTLVSRQAIKADFNLTAVNTQTYTFTPTATVNKLRFMFVERPNGYNIVKSLTATVDKSQAIGISGPQTAILVYNKSLSTSGGIQGSAYGRDATSALSVDIYAVYENASGVDVAVKLTAQIKDCACCGAKISPTVWRVFMCHNVGADQSLDPFTPVPALRGAFYYQGGATNYNYYITNGWTYPIPKGTNDPCPAGYRVPTGAEWQGVVENNTPTYIGAKDISGNGGMLVGQNLMLPVVGFTGNILISTFPLHYWSSTDRQWLCTTGYGASNIKLNSWGDPGGIMGPVRCMSMN